MRTRILRSLVGAVVALAVVAAPALAGAESATNYPDFQSNAWWATYMQAAVATGLIQGEGHGAGQPSTLSPNQPVTRAEWATMLVRAAGYTPQGSATQPFKDVAASDWFASDVDTLVAQGVIRPVAYPSGDLNPDGPITRAEAAAWAGRVLAQRGVAINDLAKVTPMTVMPPSTVTLLHTKTNPPYSALRFASVPLPAQAQSVTFTDLPASTPGYNSIMTAARYGVISGFPGGTFQPDGTLTRAQAAKMIDILANETTAGAPSIQTVQSALGGYLNTITAVEKTASTSSTVTAQTIWQAFLKDGIQRYGAAWAVEGPGEPVQSIVTAKTDKSLVLYSTFTVQQCRPVYLGAAVAEADCVIGIRAYTASGPVAGQASDYGWLVYFTRAKQGWLVSQTVSYFDTPPWFASAN